VHHPRSHLVALQRILLPFLLIICAIGAPDLAIAQASPFMTGATSLQTNLLAWLTPVAIILVMVLGGMAMANRIAQVSNTYGQGDAHTIVENCGNTLILRCSASEGGGTARFASQLIGEREVTHTAISRSRRATELFGSITHSQHLGVEPAILPSQIEQLPDLAGYLKYASDPTWHRVRLDAKYAWQQQRSNELHGDTTFKPELKTREHDCRTYD
jgi:Type IV secretion-system coupling protein DNA-binding domain